MTNLEQVLSRQTEMIQELIRQRERPISQLPFHEQLALLRNKLLDVYTRITVDLAVARPAPGERQAFAGAGIFVRSATDDPDATMDIRLWRPDNPSIPVRMQTQLLAPFNEFFIINTAQAGRTLDLFISREPELFKLIESPSLDADILSELQGSTTGTFKNVSVAAVAVQIWALNTARKSVLVQNSSISPTDVFLGFDNTVASTKAFARLTPGQSWNADDYRGEIQAIGSGAGPATVHANEVG